MASQSADAHQPNCNSDRVIHAIKNLKIKIIRFWSQRIQIREK